MKSYRLLLVLALCAPLPVFAQPIAPSAATMVTPANVYGHQLDRLQKEIIGAADAMPADKYDFAPTQGDFKGVRTFGSQVKHLAETNYMLFKSWNLPNYVNPSDIEGLKTKDQIMKALRDSYDYAHAAMKTITAENAFAELGEHKQTRAGIATMALAHSMDHYGQMVEYLRMNNIVPPASRK